jgi:ADP-ribose pyrophosphatase
MNEKTLRRKSIFKGRILKLEVLDVELESGVRSKREIIRHPGAVVILAQLPDGRFVLVKQFRKAIERSLLEAVAGTLGAGEDPGEAARRELQEETGYRAKRLVKLGRLAAAPGYCDEVLHAYYAELTLAQSALAPDEDEKIDVVRLSAADLERKIVSGEICDSKTLAVWLLWEKKREAKHRRRPARGRRAGRAD